MDISLPLNAVLDRIDYSSFDGELGVRNITGVASLKDARKGDASFISSTKYLEDLRSSEASLVILSADIICEPKRGQLFLKVENPSIEIAKLCELVASHMWPKYEPEVHRLAVIDPTASVDPTAHIGPFVTIGENVEIGPGCVILSGASIGHSCKLGKDCHLSANVTLERDSILGDRVRIHPGAVLGSDGFGYEFEGGRHRKVPQIGSVEVGDDVEIGANTTVDRGRFGPTRIGEGTKIDNLVQIGHNTVIGKHCILCGLVGIAGSTTIGNYVVMGGSSGAAGHLTIGDGAQLAGRCTVYSDIEGGKKYGGDPAVPLVAYQRIRVVTRKLPELFSRLKNLEAQLLEK